MDAILYFLESNKLLMSGLVAISAAFNVIGWLAGAIYLFLNRGKWQLVNLGPIGFSQRDQAIAELLAFAREWKSKSPTQRVDIPKVERTVDRALSPEGAAQLAGKSILWVDDHPENNRLALRALARLRVNVQTAIDTDAALEHLRREPFFDLIISDMGRGDNMRAGYELLDAVRREDPHIPFAVFAGSDTEAFRREATALGAQLSTNDVIELMNFVVSSLSDQAQS